MFYYILELRYRNKVKVTVDEGLKLGISVGSNPVCGFEVLDIWRVWVGSHSSILVDEPGFRRV